ncbi:MAG: HAMP domain-containing protein [Candidatus Latescibacterota bacterium]|nr:MAG: HAMP domain-containing protein [Candidatus Latescibacterota bacterium]
MMPSILAYRPRLNLKAKFAVVTGAGILAAAMVITTFLTHQQGATIREELARRAVALTENLAYNCQLPLVTQNTTSLQRLGIGVLKDAEVAYVQFHDSRGAVVVRVGAVDWEAMQPVDPENPPSIAGETRTVWRRDADGVRYLDVRVPVTLEPTGEQDILAANRRIDRAENVGSVRVGMTTQAAEQRIAGMKQLATLLGIAIAMVASLAAAWVIHTMIRPLAQLMEGNRRVARGDFSLRLQVGSGDEFGRLAGSWNQMADEIQRSRELADSYFDTLRANAEDLEEANRALQLKNDEIAKVSRMKSEFLAMMSHELRTPLNGIIGFSEVLLDEKFGDLNEKQKRFTQNTLTSGRHLLRLISDLLDLSKIEAGRMEIAPAEFHLPTAFDEIEALVRSLAAKKGVALHFDEIPACSALTDVKLFKQVMVNLLSNAIKFTPAEGRVDVRVRCVDGRELRAEPISHAMPSKRRDAIPDQELLRVEVRDTGVGIAPEDHEKIFLAFHQSDSSYTRHQEGTGLGLALTRRVVRLLGGDIWFTSQPDEGSCFIFYVMREYDDSVQERVEPVSQAAETTPPRSEVVDQVEQSTESTPDIDSETRTERALWPWGSKAVWQGPSAEVTEERDDVVLDTVAAASSEDA